MEAADGQPNNAKVIVQFTDPSDLFNTVAPLLQSRLPLGNLHWKSPTRPLRSIEELDVSLEYEAKQTADGSNTARRHQIPGLRQTPFVKILLVRCDDKERYKETVRKEVKDWVKGLGFSTSGKNITNRQERHDAYEYLILHVVVAGTPAAVQPKSSKHISAEAAESTDSVNSKSKWTGKSTSTIFDKLRADFSSSSKAPFERVAQVRLLDPTKPSTALSPLELEQQWQDLVEKLKAAILQSFDVRVAQYEDDIRERESQRSLPGWNFCTFFILKEGLARGFENVGLIEDALKVYEELDLGLDAVIQEQATAETDATNVLLPFAVGLKDTIRTVLEAQRSDERTALVVSLQAWTDAEASRFPWRLERRDYQNMILTNQVSVLDFRIYIFIRQMQILLRQASMPLPAAKSRSLERQNKPRWDADILSEVCERSVRFMNLAARNLRQDLLAAWGGQEGLPKNEAVVQEVAINNIVASWKWASLLQTLAECQIISSLSALSTRLHEDVEGSEPFDPKVISNSRVRADSVSTEASEKGVNGTTSDIFAMLRVAKGSKTELVFQAAELFTMLRTIFLDLCRQTGWLKTLDTNTNRSAASVDVAGTGILAPSLRSMLRSEDIALSAYKLLTVCACQCYTSAGKSRASRQMLFDLAKLELHKGNLEGAVGWLDVVPGFLDTPPATRMDLSMLKLYIDCLRAAGRKADLVKSLFLYMQSEHNSRRPDTQQMWEEMHDAASQLEDTSLEFDAIFDLVAIDDFITHDATENTSMLALTLGIKLSIEELKAVQISVCCQSRGQHLPTILSFDHEGMIRVEDGNFRVNLRSRCSTEGWYDIVSITLKAGNIVYKHDLRQSPVVEDDDFPALKHLPALHSVYLYPRIGSPAMNATHAPLVDLSTKRQILVSIDWQSDDIQSAQLRLKPATAGLRLDLQSTAGIEKEDCLSIVRQDDTHVLVFDTPLVNGISRFELPYALDDPSTLSVSLRAELAYSTSNGSFQLHDFLSLMVLLPISVNVQDLFQNDAAYSRFTFSPSRLIPILILRCELEGGGGLEIQDGATWRSGPVQAFPKQPVNWIVQMTRTKEASLGKLDKPKMSLSVAYSCFDDVILNTVLESFRTRMSTSSYAYALRPLQAHLRNKLQNLWTESEIEMCALIGEVEMWDFDLLDWPSILHAFSKADRPGLESWLRNWHESCIEYPLELQATESPSSSLRLKVEPPETQIIITTLLRISSSVCVVGRPCIAELSVSAKAFPGYDLDEIEISLEIPAQSQNTSENWLLGGQRRASFRATLEFRSTIILVAQKTGELMLPGIDVKCRCLGPKAGTVVNFETEHLSSATSIQAKSAIDGTTVGIADGDGTEKHWLINASKSS